MSMDLVAPPGRSIPTPEQTRFEIELEFVQCLANPYYLQYLAQSEYLTDPCFLNYLEYLEYWRRAEYSRFLIYPSYSLSALSLLKQERFRKEILSPDTVKWVVDNMVMQQQEETRRSRERQKNGSGGDVGRGVGAVAATNGQDGGDMVIKSEPT